MTQTQKNLLLFFTALLCSCWVFLNLPAYTGITEVDDIYVAGIAVLPALLLSTWLCVILIRKKAWKRSLAVLLCNSLNAGLALVFTHEDILTILSLNDTVYQSRVPYTSFQVFLFGVLPAVFVAINWILILRAAQQARKNDSEKGSSA
ncbi:MAG: hypothetical protein D3924_05620 [Candidatus Electrothrix sp. AR4]|nr:hypothetical protein [Candidatus Electrothrix sp. AR4]